MIIMKENYMTCETFAAARTSDFDMLSLSRALTHAQSLKPARSTYILLGILICGSRFGYFS